MSCTWNTSNCYFWAHAAAFPGMPSLLLNTQLTPLSESLKSQPNFVIARRAFLIHYLKEAPSSPHYNMQLCLEFGTTVSSLHQLYLVQLCLSLHHCELHEFKEICQAF